MAVKAYDILFMLLGSVIGCLAIMTSEYAAALTGYLVLTLGFILAFTMAMYEGRPYGSVSRGIKVFMALSLLVWLLAVVAAAAMAAF